MRVLIVESEPALAELWAKHLRRQAALVTIAGSERAAIEAMQQDDVDVIVLDLVLAEGSAFAVADFASYRQPDAPLIFVTNT